MDQSHDWRRRRDVGATFPTALIFKNSRYLPSRYAMDGQLLLPINDHLPSFGGPLQFSGRSIQRFSVISKADVAAGHDEGSQIHALLTRPIFGNVDFISPQLLTSCCRTGA